MSLDGGELTDQYDTAKGKYKTNRPDLQNPEMGSKCAD